MVALVVAAPPGSFGLGLVVVIGVATWEFSHFQYEHEHETTEPRGEADDTFDVLRRGG